MNKKIFAALASATMALSATGSLAVFAEDFDVVTEADGNNGGVTGVVVPNASVKLNSENFPDQGFLNSLLTAFNKAYGEPLDSDTVKAVKTLYVGENVKDLAGISVFGNLEKVLTGSATWDKNTKTWTSISSDDASEAKSLVTADLSENTKLDTIKLTHAPKLATVKVPAGKTLQHVTITGVDGDKAPITELDLSQNKWLHDVTVNFTDIAKLDLSGNGYLVKANLRNNDLNTIDFTQCFSLETANVSNNELYGIELPDSPDLKALRANNNLLQKIDLTNLKNLTKLQLANNELRDIDLSNNKNITTLNVEFNHIGALSVADLKIANWKTSASKPGDDYSSVSPQIIYVGAKFDAVNLADNFDGFEKSNVTSYENASYETKTGLFTFGADADVTPNYVYKAGGDVNARVYVVKADILNRLYNPNSGEHFYTKDLDEKDALVKLGWQDEGIGWVSPTESTVPVYRLYNPNAGDHHYTTNAFERDTLTSVGWKNEGIGWYSYKNGTVSAKWGAEDYPINAVNVLREYNPNAKAAGAHNYTINHAENDFLVSVGWLDEGIAWGAMK